MAPARETLRHCFREIPILYKGPIFQHILIFSPGTGPGGQIVPSTRSGRSTEIPLHRCAACGGQWFRVVEYYRFRKETPRFIWQDLPRMIGQLSPAPMSVLVCLCGTPVPPSWSGLGGGNTPVAEAQAFRYSWECVSAREQEKTATLTQGFVVAEDFDALAARLRPVQRRIAQSISRENKLRQSPRGRYWSFPERLSACPRQHTLTRDDLVLRLQQDGFLFGEARDIVKFVFDGIRKGLESDGRVSALPLGVFTLVPGPNRQERVRFGKKQTLFRNPKKVQFTPSKVLRELLAPPPHKLTRLERMVTPKPIPAGRFCCEKCSSTHFVDAEFRQYRVSPSFPGFEADHDCNPVSGLVCLCGHLVCTVQFRPDWKRQIYAGFRQALEGAIQYRYSSRALIVVDRIMALHPASKKRYDNLADRVAHLEQVADFYYPRHGASAPYSRLPLNQSSGVNVRAAITSVPDPQQQCERCGSLHFFEAELFQYQKLAGADLSRIAKDPKWDADRSLVCLCGQPVYPGPLRTYVWQPERAARFKQSFENATQFQRTITGLWSNRCSGSTTPPGNNTPT